MEASRRPPPAPRGAGRPARGAGFDPPAEWRDGLHFALAKSDGAVLLLSEQAVESDWVLKEATILTWMRAVGVPVVIVPVLVGVAAEQLSTRGFGPVHLQAP